MSTAMAQRGLFGGAITMDIPTSYADARQALKIGDDTSLVVEVLGLVEEGEAGGDLWAAARYHFESIAHDNSSLSNTILTPSPPLPLPSTPLSSPTTPAPVILTGTQTIHKFSHDPTGAPRPGHETDVPDTVWIGLALWRIWTIAPGGPGSKKADVVCSVNVNLSAGDGSAPREREEVERWWTAAVGSLRIVDFRLFADEL